MPTYESSRADAVEAVEALTAVAHTIRGLNDPREFYPLIGELLTATRLLSEVTTQFAGKFQAQRGIATDDAANARAGGQFAQAASDQLRVASALLDQADDALDIASGAASQIAWPLPQDQLGNWVNIVFLQGDEAYTLIDGIPATGTDPVIEYLAGHDAGDETIGAALENGYIYDQPPVSAYDLTATRDVYTLVYNPFHGYIGLYRQEDALPGQVLPGLNDPQHETLTGMNEHPHMTAATPTSARRERLGTPGLDTVDGAPAPVSRGVAL